MGTYRDRDCGTRDHGRIRQQFSVPYSAEYEAFIRGHVYKPEYGSLASSRMKRGQQTALSISPIKWTTWWTAELTRSVPDAPRPPPSRAPLPPPGPQCFHRSLIVPLAVF